MTWSWACVCLAMCVLHACDPYKLSDSAPPHVHALRVLKELQVAEQEFRSHQGHYGNLTEIREQAGPSRRVLLNAIASKTYHGYVFRFRQEQFHYEATATPTTEALGDKTSYYTDESALIRYSRDPAIAADRNSPPLK